MHIQGKFKRNRHRDETTLCSTDSCGQSALYLHRTGPQGLTSASFVPRTSPQVLNTHMPSREETHRAMTFCHAIIPSLPIWVQKH